MGVVILKNVWKRIMKQQTKSDLLQEWRSGTISAENKRKLELEALNDDFLFEAMEGYAQHKTVSNNDRLSEKLLDRVSKKDVSSKLFKMWLPRVAVAASLLLVMSLFWWSSSSDNKQYAAAEDMSKPMEETVDQAGSNYESSNDEYAAVLDENVLEKNKTPEVKLDRVQKAKSSNKPKPTKDVVDDFLAQKPVVTSHNVELIESDEMDFEEAEVEEVIEEVSEGNNNTTSSESAVNEPMVEEEISIVSEDRLPPPPPAVMKKEAKRAVPGNEVRKKEARPEMDGVMTMEDDQLNIRYEVAPIKGWDIFDKYIEDERLKSASALRANIKGKVVVEFNIDEKGYPINIKIIESNWSALNENAIKLIQFGGRWITNDLSKPVRYVIDYP